MRRIIRSRVAIRVFAVAPAGLDALFSFATGWARRPTIMAAPGGRPRSDLMKTIASAAVVLSLLGAGAAAQTLDDLKKDGNGGPTDNVLTYGMGYHQQRYSPLKQIDRQTINRLVPFWNLTLDNNWGEQAQPIVYDGVMYVTNAKATVAIDVATGKQIWKQTLDWPPETPRVVCCGVSNKGAAIYNGKVFRTTLMWWPMTPRTARSCGSRRPRIGRTAIRSPSRRWSPTACWSPAFPVPSSAFAASSTAGTARPARICGGATRFRPAARRATKPGRRTPTPGRSAAARRGSPAPTIPSSI